MTSFYYYDQDPSDFCFLVLIRAFVFETSLGYERKNKKDSGRSSKMTPSCKWPACYDHLVSIIHDSLLLNFDLGLMAERCLHSYEYPYTGLLIGCGKKWEIMRHFQGKLCGKKGLLCGKLCYFFKADLTLFF